MHFTSETSSNGVIERKFILDEITGVLWSPTFGTVGSPLLLAGHTGGMHKKAPGAGSQCTPQRDQLWVHRRRHRRARTW